MENGSGHAGVASAPETLIQTTGAQTTEVTLPADHITITPIFDSSVTSSSEAASYKSAVNTAIQFFESHFVNPAGGAVDLSIEFGYGENAGTAIPPQSGANSQTTGNSYTYGQLYSAFQATDTTSTVQKEAAASLPSSDPTGNTGTFFVTPADALALGLVSPVAGGAPTFAGSIGLSQDTYNWSETGTQNPAGSDVVSEFEHEISEVLGRTDAGGVGGDYNPLDLFRYTAADGKTGDVIGSAAGARDEPFVSGYDANASSYFSYDGKTVTLEYDTPTEVSPAGGGEDIGDWTTTTSPVYMDSFDGAGPPGEIDPVSTTDLQEMNVLGYDLVAPVCYLAGTRILTPTGEMCVEALRRGDRVMTRFGGLQRIKWIGRQSYLKIALPEPREHYPVHLRPGSLGEGLPARDLYVSPGHSMLVDDTLVLAKSLVNGITITQTECPERIEYFQIELERHDCVIAEGTWSETYADWEEGRKCFHNAAEFHALFPEYRPPETVSLCAARPERGAALEAVLRPIVAQAAQQLTPGPLMGFIDRVRGEWKLEGWAHDASHPELPVLLEILLEGRVLGTVLACDYREDLFTAGYGQGCCSFTFISPIKLRGAMLATLEVRRAVDGALVTVSRSIIDAALEPAAPKPRLAIMA